MREIRRGVTRKEPRVAAKRIEHRIKSEQCRSKWRARSQRTFIRYRQKFPQSNDGAGGLLQARRHPSKDLDRSRTVQRVFLDRHSGHRLLRQSERWDFVTKAHISQREIFNEDKVFWLFFEERFQFVAARVRDKICKSLRQICIAAILRQPLQEIVMKLFERIEVYNDFTPRSAAMNMAIDEALLETANAASIRFYRWQSPAISFGYFGRFADVAEYASERDLVRRWTGGGIVFHGEDLTYSIVIPENDQIFTGSSMSIYEKIHRALADALTERGQRATIAAIGDRGAGVSDAGYNEHCFSNPVRADVMLNGRKIAGAAQRRTRRGLLHQGSIQDVELGSGLAERFAQALCAKCRERKIDNDVLKRACELAKQKYGTESWLRKR